MQWFCGLDKRISVERVLHEARAMVDFGVLCLQEVAINYPRLEGNAGFDQVARVCDLPLRFEVCFGAAADELGSGGERRRFGNLIASRWPVAQVQHHALPLPPRRGCARCRACAPARPC